MSGLYLSQLSSLSSPHVHIKNANELERKISIIMSGGSGLLQIITDFDRTLTANIGGVPVKSSYAIFELCPSLPVSFIKACKELRDKYLPIEMSHEMSVEEKIPHIIEWWKMSEHLCRGLVVEKESIDKAVTAANVKFRDGTSEMFKSLYENSVPVLVFSAGIGDVITAVLRHESILYKNVHVISNFFKFDGSTIVGYSGPAIHVFNKNLHAVKNSNYFNEVNHRTSVILLGDSLGDANMDEGLTSSATVLKIGFLSSDHNKAYLSQYMNKFDIVLVNDQTMTVPMEIINSVL